MQISGYPTWFTVTTLPKNVALLRVGADSRCGRIHSPLFEDDTFDFLPIPDSDGPAGGPTYGTTMGRAGRFLYQYFPSRRQESAKRQAIHADPEFESFTYGDPTRPKRSLRRLKAGDLLVFYASMEGRDCARSTALYLVGYLEIEFCDFAVALDPDLVKNRFAKNAHVLHRRKYDEQYQRLLLIAGGPGSRLFRKAYHLGGRTELEPGRHWQVISPPPCQHS